MKKSVRSLFAMSCIVALQACSSPDGDSLERAKAYVAEGNRQAAIIELKNAVRDDPQAGEARWLLGTLSLETGDAATAEKELRRAQKLGWNPNDVTPVLAQAFLTQRKNQDLLALTVDGLEPGGRARLRAAQASAKLAQGDLKAAEQLSQKALEDDPTLVQALLVQARTSLGRGDLNGAMLTIDTILESEPTHHQALTLQGDILASQGETAQAIVVYGEVLALRDNDMLVRFKRASNALANQDYELAKSDATHMLAQDAHHPAGNFIQGVLEYQAGNYTQAITALTLAEPAAKQFPIMLFYLGSAHLAEGNLDQAVSYANHFHEEAPNNVSGRKLLAYVRLRQNKPEDVIDLLQPVLEAFPEDVDALNLIANAYLTSGQTEAALTALEKVTRIQPESPAAQLRLGAGLMLNDEKGSGIDHINSALELDPKYQQADMLLVLNHLRSDNFDAAIKAAKDYQRRNPISVTPLNLLGRVYGQAGQVDEARKAFGRALQLEPHDPAANHNMARLAMSEDDNKSARAYYQTILAQQSDSLVALLGLAEIDARESKESEMVNHLDQAARAHPNALQPRLLLGRYYLGKGRTDRIAPLFSYLSKAQQKNPEVLKLLAMAQLANNSPGEATRTLEQLQQEVELNADAYHLLAVAAIGEKNVSTAQEHLLEAIKLDENHVPSLLILARMALADERQDDLQGYLTRLEKLAPGTAEVLMVRASAAKAGGELGKATQLAQQALETAPSTQALMRVASYQREAGNEEAAAALIEGWLEQHPEDLAARLTLAAGMQLEDDIDAAKKEYSTILEQDSDNVIALNNMAWNLRHEDTDRALELIHKASALAPESAEVLDTQAVVEYIAKDYRRAARSIRRALALGNDNPTMAYHSAMIDAALGNTAQAAALLSQLLQDNPAFAERDEASKLLAELSK